MFPKDYNMQLAKWLRLIIAQQPSLRIRGSRHLTRRRAQKVIHEQQQLESLEARILLTSDFGDAADTTGGTGTGDYQTLGANNGPSHNISTTQASLFLGASVDGEGDASATSRANGDDIASLPNDEDGLIEPSQDLVLTAGTSSVVRVRATNTTGTVATLYGWIDYNRDGVFDNSTERTSVGVPTSTSHGTFTLTFPTIPVGTSAGGTYARFRLSTDVAAANSIGAASDGEVEDYAASIIQRSNSTVISRLKIASGTTELTTVQNIAVTFSDANELLSFISGTTGSIAENEAVSVAAYTAVATDPDTTSPNNHITYTIKPGVDDAALVAINATTGSVTLIASADFESKSSYLFTVVATDGGSPALSAETAVTINVLDQAEGTAGDDAFVLTYSSSGVAITVSTDGAAATSLGTFPLDQPLTLFGLGGTDSVRVVGTSSADTFTVSGTGLTINGDSLTLTSIENRTLAGMAGNDVYQFDVDASLGLFTLDESGGGIDTIDFSLTTTASIHLALNLGTGAPQVVHANLKLSLGSFTTFENIVGGSGNDTLTGNSLANTLTGNGGNDTLTGGRGDDSLVGGSGDDTYLFTSETQEEAEVEDRYQAWVSTLTPAQQEWEGTLQAELGSYYLPIHKREKVAGRSNAWDFVEDDPALPRVLLIGDSVSRAYTLTVRKELAGIANVHRAPSICGPTSNGLNKLDVWLGEGKWDVIHFNFGIHDRRTPLADYTTQLQQLVERMQLTGAELAWASTTPIPDVPGTYSPESIAPRNAAAASVMQEHGVPIDDLFTAITPHLAEWQNPNDVHFSEPGNEFLGKQVATFLKSMIPTQPLNLKAASVFKKIVNGSSNDAPSAVSGVNSLGGGLGAYSDVSIAEADTVTEAANGGTDTISFNSLTTDVIVSLGTTAVQTVHANRTLKLNAIDVIENIEGGLGNDTLTGNSLANALTGNDGSDVLSGGSGDDSLVGGSGDDTYVFATATTAEADSVAEATNAGTDTLSFSSLTTNVVLGLETSLVQSVHSNRTLKLNAASVFENIEGGSGNDTLTGNSLANTLSGNAGNDTLSGRSGNDSLVGGLGDDNYVFTTATTAEADTVAEAANAGTDTLSFSTLTTDLILNLEAIAIQMVHVNRMLTLNSIDVFENIVGGSGNDTLTGNSLANTLTGSGGNDKLNGGGGNDSLVGGSGDDTYLFATATSAEADRVTEAAGAGTDTISFSSLSTDVIISLETSLVQTVHANRTLKLNAIDVLENIIGGSRNDTLTGNSLANTLTGGNGDDRLLGGSGDDTYVFGTAPTVEADTVTEVMNAGADTLSFSSLTTNLILSLETTAIQTVHSNRTLKLNAIDMFENIVGGSGNDTLTGNALANTLTGGSGNDSLIGRAGDDTYVFTTATTTEADSVAEATNAGTDTLSFSSLTTDLILGLETSFVQTVHANRTLKLNAASVFENIVGGTGNDMLMGNALANTLTGNAGNDTLNGRSGDDCLVGGLGNDTYVFSAATTAEADTVIEAANAGTDTLSFSSLSTDMNLSLETTAVQTVHANRTLTLNAIDGLENIIGGSGNDALTGNSLANTLTGNAGNDTLTGGSGDDSLAGGLGNDTYVFGTATTAEADTVAEATNAGTDTLSFSSLTTDVVLGLETSLVQTVHANRTLKLNAASVFENIVGGSGDDTLTGNSFANTLIGNDGNDKLTGVGGADSLVGGLGDDTYVFATATIPEADTVTEGTNAGTDTLWFSTLTTDLILSLETTAVQPMHVNRTLTLNAINVFENMVGGSGNDTLTGNSLANNLVGNAGNDTLSGVGGRDILIGGLGLDMLNGGDDDDIMIAGRTTSDTLLINLNRVLAEWLSANSYGARINNLRTGVGASSVSLKAKVNVQNDSGEDDMLVGGNGTDWYFRALDDVVTGLATGEILDIL